jgi:hypothetical protein
MPHSPLCARECVGGAADTARANPSLMITSFFSPVLQGLRWSVSASERDRFHFLLGGDMREDAECAALLPLVLMQPACTVRFLAALPLIQLLSTCKTS